jgi:hypothetical protein
MRPGNPNVFSGVGKSGRWRERGVFEAQLRFGILAAQMVQRRPIISPLDAQVVKVYLGSRRGVRPRPSVNLLRKLLRVTSLSIAVVVAVPRSVIDQSRSPTPSAMPICSSSDSYNSRRTFRMSCSS